MERANIMDMLTLARTTEPALKAVSDKVLWNALVMWLFRGQKFQSLHARLKKICGKQVNTLSMTQALTSSGSIMRGYKLWLFYVVKRKVPYEEAAALAEKWGVSPQDVAAFSQFCQRPTLVYLTQLGRKYAALTQERFDAICTSICPDLRATARKFVYVKLRFIANHQRTGMNLEDLESETVAHGLEKLLLQYPLIESKLHALNVARHVVRNHGLNLIQKYTRIKNNVMVAADGAQTLVLDVNNLPSEMQVAAPAQRETSDLYLDYKGLVHKFKDKRRTVLALLSGLYHKGFSDWLNTQGVQYPNDEFIDRTSPKRYLKMVREWVGVPEQAFNQFVDAVRTVFAPYQARVA